MAQEYLSIATGEREELVDITAAVAEAVTATGIPDGNVCVYVPSTTAAIILLENFDDSIQQDVVDLLERTVPRGMWFHDKHDHNGDAHLKSGIVGQSTTIPLRDGQMILAKHMSVFFCEFDGPTDKQDIIVSVTPA